MKKALALASAVGALSLALAGSASAACFPPYCPAPSAANGSVTPTDTTAAITGAVNSNGSGTTQWQIQLGTAPGNFTVLVAQGAIPDGTAAVGIGGTATGLTPGTTYFYRVVATSAGGYRATVASTFATLATPVPPPPPENPPSTNPPSDAPSTNPTARIVSVRLRVTPRRDRRAPYRYRVSGRARVSEDADCGGRVRIRFERGDRRVASATTSLGSDCTFERRARVPTRRLNDDGGRLRVSARALGTATLSARSSDDVTVRYG